MRAAVLEAPEKLVVREVPLFPLKSDEVQIQVSACGICGSDLRYLKGENPWALHTLGKHIDNPPNIILGHEFCGIVSEVGSAEHEHLLGKRVVIAPYRACGACQDCRRGDYHLCKHTMHTGHAAGWGKRPLYPGGMAQFCPIWADKCYELPEAISDGEAAMLDIAGVGIHALNVAGARAGQSILVIGCGPLGYSIFALGLAWGASARFASEPNPLARSIISSQGGTVFAGSERDLAERILEDTNGRGVDAVFDTVGTQETLALGRAALASKGTIVVLAIHHERIELSLDELGRERSIRSSCNYLFPEFKLAIDMAAAGKIDLAAFVTHQLPLEQAREAFAIAGDRTGSGSLKVVLKP